MLGLQLTNPRQPVLAHDGTDLRQQLVQNGLHIAPHRCRRSLDFPKFGGVDINVNDSGVGAKLCDSAGCPVIKARPDGDQQVALVKRHVRAPCAMHPEHAERQGMINRHGAQGH